MVKMGYSLLKYISRLKMELLLFGLSYSLVAQIVKNLSAMQETRVQSLGLESPLENEINGNPLQYSYLGSPTDRKVWWATVHMVTKSRI